MEINRIKDLLKSISELLIQYPDMKENITYIDIFYE